MFGVTDTTDPVQDVIAGGVLVLGVLQYLAGRRSKANATKLDDVHSLVNQQLTDSVDRRDVAEARTRVLEDEAQASKKKS